MATKPRSVRAKSPATFESINPATGEVVGVFPIFTKSEVDEVVTRAKVAAERWANLSFRARQIALRDWASILTRDMREAAELIHRETGKPLSDATLEVALAIEHIGWAGKFAPRVLGRQNRPAGLLMFNMSAQVQRVPFGVVGVILLSFFLGMLVKWSYIAAQRSSDLLQEAIWVTFGFASFLLFFSNHFTSLSYPLISLVFFQFYRLVRRSTRVRSPHQFQQVMAKESVDRQRR